MGGNRFGQDRSEVIEIPCGMTKETMEAAPMAITNVATGKNDLGHITMTVKKAPSL